VQGIIQLVDAWKDNILAGLCKILLRYTCCGVLAGLLMLWQAICIAWFARANCDWSTRPGRPGSLAGSAVPTRYAAYTRTKLQVNSD